MFRKLYQQFIEWRQTKNKPIEPESYKFVVGLCEAHEPNITCDSIIGSQVSFYLYFGGVKYAPLIQIHLSISKHHTLRTIRFYSYETQNHFYFPNDEDYARHDMAYDYLVKRYNLEEKAQKKLEPIQERERLRKIKEDEIKSRYVKKEEA